jgi:predicted RNA-binding protein associated with RNAse of E/G family
MDDILVRKLNPARAETWRYRGRILRQSPEWVLLEARFNRPDLPFHGIVLGQGDRFVEAYFTRRWFNIFEIHSREDNSLKGWYCNVTRPAELSADGNGPAVLSYVDLFLDLLVYPDGRQLVLDEDEFADANLDAETSRKARSALEELKDIFGAMPFELEGWLGK